MKKYIETTPGCEVFADNEDLVGEANKCGMDLADVANQISQANTEEEVIQAVYLARAIHRAAFDGFIYGADHVRRESATMRPFYFTPSDFKNSDGESASPEAAAQIANRRLKEWFG